MLRAREMIGSDSSHSGDAGSSDVDIVLLEMMLANLRHLINILQLVVSRRHTFSNYILATLTRPFNYAVF